MDAPDPLRQLRELLAGMASCREPLEAGARTLAAALLLLRLVGLDVDGLIAASRRIVAPQARLAFALGAASALLEGPAQLLREGVRRPMEDALGGLVARLGRLAPGEADRLSRLLDVVRPSVP
ncbi:MAG: hypothetical protein QJR14_07160 [Bacillota bacterium]|nr:hypothetical protein [Bacillota bacterium]